MNIKQNIENLNKEISELSVKMGKDPKQLKLVAVSKTVGNDQIREAYGEGVFDFGENRVQDLLHKMDTIQEDISWHHIGRLQTNKVKYLIGKNILIQSLDRKELVDEISKLSIKQGINTECLVQINVSGEESKAGINPEETKDFLKYIGTQKGIIVLGLMTIAPNVEDFEEIRRVFAKMREIYIDIQNERIDNNIQMKYLSMGMSHDYKIAIEEGSNMLRIGTSIFY
ncbi:MAG: YggS family pyridoxal phosphate-dependent enzyme [Bacillota bacterium]